MFNSLKTKIVCWTVLVLVVVFLIGSFFFYSSEKNKVLESINRKAKYLTNRLSISTVGPLWNVDKEETIRLLNAQLVDKDIYAIIVLDEDNKIFAGLIRDKRWEIKRFSQTNLPHVNRYIYNHAEIIMPKGEEKERIGSVHVYITPNFAYKQLKKSAFIVLSQFGFLILLLAGVLIVFMDKIVINRIDALVNGISSVSRKDFSQEIPDLGDDEIGFLAKEFNFMVDELKKYEGELISEMRRWEVTLRAIGDGVIVTDPQGRIDLMNDVACKLTGWREDEARGRSLEEVFVIVNELTRKPVESPVRKVIRHGRIVGLANHTVLISRSGREIPIKDSAAPIKDDSGKILGIVMVFTDMSVEVDLLKKVAHSSMVQRGLMEVANVIIAITDKDDKLLFWNRAAEKITGYLRDEVLGSREGWELIYPDREYREKMLKIIHSVMDTGRPLDGGESKIITKDGDKRIIFWYSACLQGKDGESAGCLHVGVDVTYKKKLEKEILNVKKMDALSLFAGGIAHDFNNILTSIMGNISLMKYSDSPMDIQERLELVENAVNYASSLVSKLLTFSKKDTPVKEVVSPDKIIKETVELVLSGSNVKWELNIEESLNKVEVDPIQVSQVIQNIVINARQACEGRTNPEIDISAKNVIFEKRMEIGDRLIGPGRFVEVMVRDNGKGISTKDLDKIFDPFFTTKKKGHGLGLAICYSMIKGHGGEIVVESTLNKGSTFRIFIPALEIREIKIDEYDSKRTNGQFSGKVLLLEDDVMIAEVANELLKHLGFDEVVLAKEGNEAISVFKEAYNKNDKFSLVILDLTLPGGIGGQKVMEEILKIDPHVVAIVSSGYIQDPVMVEYEKYGFKAALKKPYTIQELEKVLREILAQGH